MKTKVILLAILGLGLTFTSCEKDDFNVAPSTKVTTTSFPASGITELDVSDAFNIYVNFSETEEYVFVEANENIHQLIEMSQSGNKLIVGLQKNSTISGTPVLNVHITTATLEKVVAKGAVSVEFHNPLLGNALEVDLEGACMFVGELEVDELVADLLGASELNVLGNSELFDIRAEGASIMTGFNFATNNLTANVYGASNISLTVNEKLNVTASGASNVYYKGDGVIETQNLSDTSKIVQLD